MSNINFEIGKIKKCLQHELHLLLSGSGGGEEITYYEESTLNPKEAPNLANVIAGEIVNEILENALDIATRASETG